MTVRRGFISVFAACAVGAAALSVTVTPSASAASGAASQRVLPVSVLECVGGQVDVNNAAIDALTTIPGVEGRPVADRLIAARPYASIEHLQAVSGIGPGGLSRIVASGRACVAMPQAVGIPPAFDLCTAGSVDLNTSPFAQAEAIFGKGTAERLRAAQARPMWKVEHALAIAGIGPGRIKNHHLCVTPPTLHDIDTATSWTWLDAEVGTTAVATTTDSMRLVADSGDLPGDGWIRIADVVANDTITQTEAWRRGLETAFEPAEFSPPTFETSVVKLDGTTLQPVHPVTLTYPLDPDEKELPPSVSRWENGHRVYSTDADATVDGDTITVEAMHLSVGQSTFGMVVVDFDLIFPVSGDRDQQVNWFEQRRRNVNGPACPDTGNSSPSRGTFGTVEGAPENVVTYCSYFDGNFATWRIQNNLPGPIEISPDQAFVYTRVSLAGDDFVGRSLLGYFGDDPGVYQSGSVWVPPGGVVEVQFRSHGQTNVRVGGSLKVAAAYTAANALFDEVLKKTFESGNIEQSALLASLRCMYSDDITTCLLDKNLPQLLKEAIKKVAENEVDAIRDAELRKLGKRIIRIIGIALDLGPFGSLANDSLTLRYDRPSAPARDRGRLIPPHCPVAWSDNLWEWTWDRGCVDAAYPVPPGQPTNGSDPTAAGTLILKRSNSVATFVLDTEGVAHPIPDGGTYICNAYHYPVMWNVDDTEWASLVTSLGAPATCPTGPSRALFPDTTEDFIVRQSDGSSFLVDFGRRGPIISGDAFNCLVERFLVWDWVSDDELEQIPRDPSIAARFCFP
jgi:hypothetical protein